MTDRWPKLVALLALVGLIAFALWEMRDFGDPMDEFDANDATDGKVSLYDKASNSTMEVNRTYMDEYFIDHSQDKGTSTNNAVTAIVFDWRGFDTLGEATVLFSAVCGVLLALRAAYPKGPAKREKGGDGQ
jgi:hypothetical protein